MTLDEQRAEFPTDAVRRFVSDVNRHVSKLRAAIARPEALDTTAAEVLADMLNDIGIFLDSSPGDVTDEAALAAFRAADLVERLPVGREVAERINALLRKLSDNRQ